MNLRRVSLVSSPALFGTVRGLRRGGRERSDCAGCRTGAENTNEFTTPQAQLALRFHSRALPPLLARLPGQRECFCFDLDEETPDNTDMAVEIGSVSDRHVGEEASDPRNEMLLENLLLPLNCRRKLPAD